MSASGLVVTLNSIRWLTPPAICLSASGLRSPIRLPFGSPDRLGRGRHRKCRWRKPTDTITEHLLARRATQNWIEQPAILPNLLQIFPESIQNRIQLAVHGLGCVGDQTITLAEINNRYARQLQLLAERIFQNSFQLACSQILLQ